MARFLSFIITFSIGVYAYSEDRCSVLMGKNDSVFHSAKKIMDASSAPVIRSNPEIFGLVYRGKATLEGLQQAMYESGLLVRDSRFDSLGDKLVMGRHLENILGEKAFEFYPKSREIKKRYRDGDTASQLKLLFPEGVIAKLRVDAGSGGENIIVGHNNVVRFIENNSMDILKHYFLQGDPRMVEKSGELNEFRAHSLWGQVIQGATLNRWAAFTNPLAKKPVEEYLQRFLDQLPPGMRIGQAWSFDIVEFAPGVFKIVDINISNSRGGNWSGFLQNPFILTRMVRDLRYYYGWRFPGVDGFLLKNNLGNFQKVKRKIRNMYRKHGILLRPAK